MYLPCVLILDYKIIHLYNLQNVKAENMDLTAKIIVVIVNKILNVTMSTVCVYVAVILDTSDHFAIHVNIYIICIQ